MSIIRDIIERVDDIKPNAFTPKTKLAWMSELDGKIAADVMLMGIEDIRQMEYSYPDGLEEIPLVEYPHDSLYDEYLCAKIDYANGEYSKYQNSMEMFNAHYDNFIHWFIRTYAPAKGYSGCNVSQCGEKPPYYISAYALAVRHGFSGTIDEWLESLKGDKGDKGDVTPEALEAVEKAEEFARIAEEAANSIVKGFDSGELPEGTSEYFFSPEEAEFVIVTIVGGNGISQAEVYTATIDCRGIPSDLNGWWECSGCKFNIFEHDGTIRVSLRDEDVAHGTHISRVRGYRYGSSGGSVEPLIVTRSEEGVASHTPEEMQKHVEDGGNVCFDDSLGNYIPLTSIKGESAYFTHVEAQGYAATYRVAPDRTITVNRSNLGGGATSLIVTVDENGIASSPVQDIFQEAEGGASVYLDTSEYSYIPLSHVTLYDAYFSHIDDEAGAIYVYRVNSDSVVTIEEIKCGSLYPVIVRISEDGKTASHTPEEIRNHVEEGGTVYLEVGEYYIPLTYAAYDEAFFVHFGDDMIVTTYHIRQDMVVHSSDGSISHQTTEEIVAAVIAALPVYGGEVE